MKCLVLHGSSSGRYPWNGAVIEGFTERLVRAVQDEMLSLGPVEFTEVHLRTLNLPHCRGCYRCFDEGEGRCPHAAIIQPIMEAMQDADCVILSSPVYALNVSGLVKTFFDLTAYTYHRPRFFSKKALVVSSTAGGGAGKVCGYMRDTLMHWGFNRVYTLGVVRMGARDPDVRMRKRCKKAAHALYTDVSSGRLRAPAPGRLFFYQLWRGMARARPDSADGRYWRESGLDAHSYGPQVPLGPFGRLFAGAVNALFRRVMK